MQAKFQEKERALTELSEQLNKNAMALNELQDRDRGAKVGI